MERKNYLLEELSEDEDKYIICAINKAFLSSIRKYSEDKKIRKYSIDDVNIQEQLPVQEDAYFEESLNQDEFWDSSLVSRGTGNFGTYIVKRDGEFCQEGRGILAHILTFYIMCDMLSACLDIYTAKSK